MTSGDAGNKPITEQQDGDVDARGMALFAQFRAMDEAFQTGDLPALRTALGDPSDFPNCALPGELDMGLWPLAYAISASPPAFVSALLEAGADVNFADHDGFPALMAALASDREDRLAVLKVLIGAGADIAQRGVDGWTALHYAVSLQDKDAMRVLLEHGADPLLPAEKGAKSSPLEDAEAADFQDGVDLLCEFLGQGGSGRA